MVPEGRGRKVQESVRISENHQKSRARMGLSTDVELVNSPRLLTPWEPQVTSETSATQVRAETLLGSRIVFRYCSGENQFVSEITQFEAFSKVI